MADDGIGITGAICLLAGGILGGKLLSRWESKLDRHVVCEELDRYVQGLERHCQSADEHRELMEIKRGVEQVRKGQIPFDDGPGFLESLWTKSKDLGSKLNPTKIWRGSGKTTSNGSPQDQPADPPTAPSPA